MAMEDYFQKCNKLIVIKYDDGMGGVKILHEKVDGNSFMGLAVRRSNSEQIIGSLRGYETEMFNFHCDASVKLEKDDKVRYTDVDGSYKYLRLTSSQILNTPLSNQTGWKTYTAETYLPVNIEE